VGLQPSRTVAELKELRELTGDENGAQRVAWTETWETARAWLRDKLAETGARHELDPAGNQWFTLAGDSERAVLIGGHLDSVPNGGWLDGCLNVLAGAEVLRRIAEEGTPPVTVRLVDWADEEGARFGRSLFGSSAASGSMRDQDELRRLTDREGISLPAALAAHGVDLDRALEARSQLDSAAAYLELHIEQGPVLESLGLPLGAVLGTFGVERHRITWRGQAAHAGSSSARSRAGSATAPSAPPAGSSAGRASSPPSSRRRSSCSTSVTSTRTSSPRSSRRPRRRARGSPPRSGSRSSGRSSGRSSRSSSTTP
jgi:N-carbamoyl-L-amino-acid hydrolase